MAVLGGLQFLMGEVPLLPPEAGSSSHESTGGVDVIQKEAWSFYRTLSGVRLCWELEEPQGPKETRSSRPSSRLGILPHVG